MTSKEWNSGTSSVATTNYTWDATTSALLTDGSDDYVYGTNGNVPIAQIATSGSITDELLTDTNSNVRGVVEISSGATSPDQLVNYVDYDAWGKPISYPGGTVVVKGLLTQSGTDTNSLTRFGYGGSYQDDTGLYFLVNRYYDQGTGQFISVDPDFTGTGEAYVYAGDNPVMAVDYLGLCGGIFSVVCGAYDATAGLVKSAASSAWGAIRIASHFAVHYLDNIRHAIATGTNIATHFAVKHWKVIVLAAALVIVGAVTGGAGDVAILDVAGEEVAFEGATEAEASVEAGDSAPEAEQDVAKNEDSQSCPTNSFAPHTLVLLANGQLIAIDKVKVGDAVEAFDTKTGKRRAERVTKVWINHDTDLLDLTFSVHGHSYELDTTQHHPFWDARTHSWVEAENLKQGTILATNTRATSQVTRSKVMTTTALMWDLTVALDHDFYVSVRSASTAVLVHNCPQESAPDISETTVRDVLRYRNAGIRKANLPKGTPSWSSIENMTMGEVKSLAQQRVAGFQTLWKLLNDSRFLK